MSTVAELAALSPAAAALGDEALLDLVQRQTLRYFWDYAHPVSGLARERIRSGTLPDSQATSGAWKRTM